MEEKKKKRKLLTRLKDRYRLVILNESTLEDVWYAVLSRFNFIIWIGFTGIFLIIIGVVLVSFTPFREYIPGYPQSDIRSLYRYNYMMVDSLEEELRVQKQYYDNLTTILQGEATKSYVHNSDSITPAELNEEEEQSLDSAFIEEFALEERYSLSASNVQAITKKAETFDLSKLHLFCPIKGSITNTYDAVSHHFGIDIVSNANEPILSVKEGTVIMAGWTLEAGYVIQIQHPNNLLSVYKHNSKLLKQMGDRVRAGEVIAIIGNTGEYTTGPHLHFELWHNGRPLNPKDYIVF
jgi:murein DD-endopeptidase MepM/ murein hydrolase activator NlpD